MPTKIHAPDKQQNRYLALMHSSPQIIRSQKNTLNREGPQPCSTKGKNMPLICFPITCFYNPQFLLFTMVLESRFYQGNTLHPHQIFLFKTTLVLVLTNISKHSSSHSQHKREKSNTWVGKTPFRTDLARTDRDFWPLSDVGTFSTSLTS